MTHVPILDHSASAAASGLDALEVWSLSPDAVISGEAQSRIVSIEKKRSRNRCRDAVAAFAVAMMLATLAGDEALAFFPCAPLPPPPPPGSPPSLSLQIFKNSIDAAGAMKPGTFNFSASSAIGTGPISPNFSVTTIASGTARACFGGQLSGSGSVPITIVEDVSADWTLTDITCTGNNVVTIDKANRSIVLNLGSARTASVACTFENTYTPAPPAGTLQLVKRTSGGDGQFQFTSTSAQFGNPVLTTVGGSAKTAATKVDAGTYTLTETAANGWKLDSISCTGNSAAATVNVANRDVSVPVAVNETVVCTFNNSEIKGRTEAAIQNFMGQRADRIASKTPAVSRLIDRLSDDPPAQVQQQDGSGDDPSERHVPMKLGRPDGVQRSTADDEMRGGGAGLGAVANGDGSQGNVAVSGSLSALAKADSGKMQLGALSRTPQSRKSHDVWFEGDLSYSKQDKLDTKSSFGLVKLGVDYKLSPGLLVGVMAQHDSMQEKSGSAGYLVKGNGWMAGPYAAARLSNNLFFDTRLLYGTSQNEISPFLTYTDSFSTTRWLAAARLSGRWMSGNWRFTPSAEIVRYTDTSKAYLDSNGIVIDSQKVSLGRVIIGPEVSYTFTPAEGFSLTPHASLKGLWDFEKPAYAAIGPGGVSSISTSNFHARLEGGVVARGASGVSVGLSGAYEGLGGDGQRTTSVRGTLKVPF